MVKHSYLTIGRAGLLGLLVASVIASSTGRALAQSRPAEPTKPDVKAKPDAKGKADAKGKPEAAPEDPELLKARALYLEGIELVKVAQWSEALSAFERSAAVKSFPITTYNIGACERALGRYTRAQRTLVKALAESEKSEKPLPPSLATEAKGQLDEIDRVLARVKVTIDPPEAGIAVDGRPLDYVEDGGKTIGIAGVATPGAGTVPKSATFELVTDPGAHLVALSRKGYTDIVLNRTFAPGFRGDLPLALAKLPGTLHIASTQEAAVVTVDGRDVGTAPVDVSRPAGSYKVVVQKDRFITYRADVKVQPGEEIDLRAALEQERIPVYKKWWFWTAATIVVAGVVTTTYYATRTDPAPVRPPVDGGNLGWTVQLK